MGVCGLWSRYEGRGGERGRDDDFLGGKSLSEGIVMSECLAGYLPGWKLVSLLGRCLYLCYDASMLR